MKPLDLSELARSDYVLVSLLIVGDKIVGYSIIDKILVGSLKSRDVLGKNINVLREGSALKTSIEINCSEDDAACIEQTRKLGLEPNRKYDVHVVLLALPTKFLDFDKLKSLVQDYLGDAVNEIVVAYGTREEVLVSALELLNSLRTISMLSSRHGEEELSSESSEAIANRIAVMYDDGSVQLEDVT